MHTTQAFPKLLMGLDGRVLTSPVTDDEQDFYLGGSTLKLVRQNTRCLHSLLLINLRHRPEKSFTKILAGESVRMIRNPPPPSQVLPGRTGCLRFRWLGHSRS